jgi:LPXTG-motif cell wall-anchored protein
MFEILMILLVTRSALEIFSDVNLGPLRLNVPALIGLAGLGLAAWLFARRKKVAWHPLATGWVIWLIVLISFSSAGGRSDAKAYWPFGNGSGFSPSPPSSS